MNEFNFRVVHMGINGGSKEEAAKIAKVFNALFGFESRETAISTFASNEIEVMNADGPGTKGHIAIGTPDLPRAMAYLETKGITFRQESAKYQEDGTLWLIYADDEIGGFAWHLVKA